MITLVNIFRTQEADSSLTPRQGGRGVLCTIQGGVLPLKKPPLLILNVVDSLSQELRRNQQKGFPPFEPPPVRGLAAASGLTAPNPAPGSAQTRQAFPLYPRCRSLSTPFGASPCQPFHLDSLAPF